MAVTEPWWAWGVNSWPFKEDIGIFAQRRGRRRIVYPEEYISAQGMVQAAWGSQLIQCNGHLRLLSHFSQASAEWWPWCALGAHGGQLLCPLCYGHIEKSSSLERWENGQRDCLGHPQPLRQTLRLQQGLEQPCNTGFSTSTKGWAPLPVHQPTVPSGCALCFATPPKSCHWNRFMGLAAGKWRCGEESKEQHISL